MEFWKPVGSRLRVVSVCPGLGFRLLGVGVGGS